VLRLPRPAIAALVASALLVGCAGQPRRAPTSEAAQAVDEVVLVHVENGFTKSVNVFAVWRGVTARLGTVGIGSPATFRLAARRLPPDGQIQIVATPVGGSGRAQSGQIIVQGGTVVQFTIGPTLVGSVMLR
jgi:hypothetical protein